LPSEFTVTVAGRSHKEGLHYMNQVSLMEIYQDNSHFYKKKVLKNDFAVGTLKKILFCLLITNTGFFMFPDRFKNTADIVPYFLPARIDLECTFKGCQGFLVLPELF